VDGGQGKRRAELGGMTAASGAGGRLQPQEGALQVDPMPRDGRSGEVYSPRALVPRQWRVGCTCVHLRKGRGSDRRMMHITVCRPDRDGRDGGGGPSTPGAGAATVSHLQQKRGVPVMPGWLVHSGGALAQNAQRCVHAESQEKEGREGGRGRGSLDTEVFAAVDEHWLGVQPGKRR